MAGRPAAGLRVSLARRDGDGWAGVAAAVTDADGRVTRFTDASLPAGTYQLTFETAAYLTVETFYPQVASIFRITDPAQRYHVPLLLSPYAYSTYRGS
jgi:5-hydroxyisourate hydrolase